MWMQIESELLYLLALEVCLYLFGYVTKPTQETVIDK
jgi:hypothetical protein